MMLEGTVLENVPSPRSHPERSSLFISGHWFVQGSLHIFIALWQGAVMKTNSAILLQKLSIKIQFLMSPSCD